MTFEISDTYKDAQESYITIPVLKKLLKMKKIPIMGTREELLLELEKYANQSKENLEDVQEWLDSTLKEGIKEILIKPVSLKEKEKEFLMSEKFEKILEDLIADKANRHLSAHRYWAESQLFRYDIIRSENLRMVSFYFGKLLFTKTGNKDIGRAVQYPIFVDIYIDLGLVVARAKSKKGMYEYKDENFNFDTANSTTVEKELKKAIDNSLEIAQIKSRDSDIKRLKEKLYYMLATYTETPKEIVEMIDNKKDEIQQLVEMFMENICSLGDKYLNDVSFDLKNLVEKYLSISYPDKDIFTLNRDAYPLRILAKDAEESKIDEAAAAAKPLQSREIFFDNKKMLQKNKACDGIVFNFLRKDPTYFTKNFRIKISIEGEYCCLGFREYTMEEDINNVLFSLINATDNSITGTN